jgi:hypothetical protein
VPSLGPFGPNLYLCRPRDVEPRAQARADEQQLAGLFWHDRYPRLATYPAGADPDEDAARQRLWDHLTTFAATTRS